jgi:hypothetical protein
MRDVIHGVQHAACLFIPSKMFSTNPRSFKDVKDFVHKRIYHMALFAIAHLTEKMDLADRRWRNSPYDERPLVAGDTVKVVGLKDDKGKDIQVAFTVLHVTQDTEDGIPVVDLEDISDLLGDNTSYPVTQLKVAQYQDPSKSNYFRRPKANGSGFDNVPRLKHVIEIVTGQSLKELIGIRVWFFTLDPMLDLGIGIQHIIEKQESWPKI